MAFKALLNAKARPFPSLRSSFLCAYCSKKLPERAPTKKKTATCTVDCRSTTCVGTSTIRLRSIKSSLPLRHSRDKLFQALSRFSVLEVVSCPDPTPHGEEKGSGYNTTSRSTLEGRNQINFKQARGIIA